MSRMTVRTPSQVFIADAEAPTNDDKEQDDDPNKRQDAQSGSRTNNHDKTGLVTVTLGAVGSIPKKCTKDWSTSITEATSQNAASLKPQAWRKRTIM